MIYEFLSDKPTGIDTFQSQAHTKIATAITEVIKEDKIKLIGLEGEWGSGKSNIIKLIEKNLNENEYIFYTYDAWGHQEDLQRRSFLENLTEVMKIKFKDNKKWSNKLNSLLATTTKTEQKEVPILSYKLVISIFILYFNNKIEKQTFLKIFNINPENWGKFKKECLFLIFDNIILILGFLGLFLYIKFKEKKKNVLPEILYLYKGKTLNTNYETIVSTEEPTVRKFKEWMEDVSETLKQKNKKMIIVYDNIDRLHSEKVKEVWSSIHTFFSECEYENITVIIPFSEKHILKALGTTKENNTNFNEGIIEKTFSVVYSVTPPVLTDWKKYFNENLKEIFPNIEDNEKNIVRTLYDKEIKNITPRGVKNFINELRVFNSIYKNIELRYIALFLLIKKNIQKDIATYFWSDEFSKYKRILGSDTDKKVLALYFGVNEDEAVQVLLERDMIKYLKEGNDSGIDHMSQISGFYGVLERVIIDLSGDEEIDKNYINILIALKNRENNLDIFQHIFESFMREEKCFGFKDYHKILLEKYNEKEREIIEKLFNIQFYNKNFEKENYVENLCNQFKEFEKYIENKGYNFKDHIKLRNYEPDIFFKLIKEFKIKYEYYGISFIKEEMEKYLIENLKYFTEEKMESVNILINKYNFSNLKQELILKIQKDTEDSANKNEYKIFTDLLSKDKEKLSDLEKEFDIQVLYRKVENSYNSNNSNSIYDEIKYYTRSLIIALASINPNNINYISRYILDYNSEEDVDKVENILINYVEIDKVLIMLYNNFSGRNLTRDFIKAVIKNKNIKYLNLENLMKNYVKIKVLIPDGDKKEFFELIDRFYNDNLNLDYKTIPTDSNLINLIIDSKDYDLFFVEYLKNLCIEYFNNEENSDYLYRECRNQNYNLLNILDVMIDNPKIQLNNSIINNFKKVLIEIVNGQISLTDKNKDILIKVEKKLSTEKLESIVNIDIKDAILKSGSLDCNKFKFLSEIFIKTKFFHFDKNDKGNQSKREDYNRLIKNIIEPYIDNKEYRDFIINCEEFRKGLKILKEYNGEFIEKLEKYSQENDKIKEFFNELKKNNNKE